jgi:hypothetical protein
MSEYNLFNDLSRLNAGDSLGLDRSMESLRPPKLSLRIPASLRPKLLTQLTLLIGVMGRFSKRLLSISMKTSSWVELEELTFRESFPEELTLSAFSASA